VQKPHTYRHFNCDVDDPLFGIGAVGISPVAVRGNEDLVGEVGRDSELKKQTGVATQGHFKPASCCYSGCKAVDSLLYIVKKSAVKIALTPTR
jgi:hypothetical protein